MNTDPLLIKPSEHKNYLLIRKEILDIVLSDVMASIDNLNLLEHKSNKCSPQCIKRGIDIGVKRLLAVIREYEKASKGK